MYKRSRPVGVRGSEDGEGYHRLLKTLQASPRYSLVQSTRFFSCSNVMKMSMVVGCSLIHAGTQPLSINIGPSFRMDLLINSNVDCGTISAQKDRKNTNYTAPWTRCPTRS